MLVVIIKKMKILIKKKQIIKNFHRKFFIDKKIVYLTHNKKTVLVSKIYLNKTIT